MDTFVTPVEVIGPFADLRRDAIAAEIPAVITEAQRIIEGDIGGVVDLDRLAELVRAPGIIWVLAQAKSRELAFTVHYGGSIPEDGGQVKYWRDIYKNGLDMIKSGEYDAQLEGIMRPRSRLGTVEAI